MAKLKIKEAAESKGRTLYWLAKTTGIAHKTLYRYQHGLSAGIQLDDLDKICAALGCKVQTVIEVEIAKPITE